MSEYMSHSVLRILVVGLTVAGLSSCATTGGQSQLETTVYATHKIARNLEQNLGGSVDKLNTTAAELSARVEQTEQQTRALQSSLEENQVKLGEIEKKLDTLTAKLYQQLGLSQPSIGTRVAPSASTPSMQVSDGTVKIEPPSAPRIEENDASAQDIQPATIETTATSAPAPSEDSASAVNLYRSAQAAYKGSKYDEALQQYTQYVDQYGETNLAGNAQFWKAECLQKLNQFDKAIPEYEKLRTSYPDNDKISYGLYNQAAAHLKLNQKEKARQLLEECVQKYPNTAPAEQAATALKKLQGN